MQLIKTEYIRPNRQLKLDDKLILIVKDKDGNKKRQVIKSPKFTYYITKSKYDDGQIKKYPERDTVRSVTCEYKNLYRSIQEEIHDKQFADYIKNIFISKNNIGEKLADVHLDRRLHNTDMNIEDFYIAEFLKDYPYEENNFGLSKMFFDIEVDSSEIRGFPDQFIAECPVNAISLVDIDNLKVYGFVLSYDGLESYDNFHKNLKSFIKKIKTKYKELLDIDVTIEMSLYDDEIDLINDFFVKINETKPDFASAWNADYDIAYLVNRITNLGYSPEEICCPEELPDDEKFVDIKTDMFKDFSEKHSRYRIAGYTNYIDEQALYANITKPLGKEESYSLDYIANKVCGLHKDEIEGSMKNFHIKNFSSFIEYNIQDSFALGMIDKTTSHIDLLYTVSMITRTTVENALKKTVCLKNLARYYAEKQGFVQSNNRAVLYPSLDRKIPGAFVGDPNKIEPVGLNIFDNLSRFIFDIVTDLDLAALYPSLIRALNMTVETYLGRVHYYPNECEENSENDKGQELIQDYMSHDIINFCVKYLNLPDIRDIIEIIESGEKELEYEED